MKYKVIMVIFQVIADDDDNKFLEGIAKEFNIDISKLQTCLDEEGIKIGKLSRNNEFINKYSPFNIFSLLLLLLLLLLGFGMQNIIH